MEFSQLLLNLYLSKLAEKLLISHAFSHSSVQHTLISLPSKQSKHPLFQTQINSRLQFELQMSLQKDSPFESRSRQTTEQDSASDRDEQSFIPRTNPAKHKTELCKTFSELGHCPYEHKCRFAHGRHELVGAPVKTASKSRKCNGFWKNGCCSYGIRCQFGHSEFKWEDRAILSALQAANEHQPPSKTSKLIRLLH